MGLFKSNKYFSVLAPHKKTNIYPTKTNSNHKFLTADEGQILSMVLKYNKTTLSEYIPICLGYLPLKYLFLQRTNLYLMVFPPSCWNGEINRTEESEDDITTRIKLF